MFEEDNRPTIVDIFRSMKRNGFSYLEIYDTFTGAGVPEGEVEELLERIEENFAESKIESRVSRLGKEVEKIFSKKLKENNIEYETQLRNLSKNVDDLTSGLERLEKRITELQSICIKKIPEE